MTSHPPGPAIQQQLPPAPAAPAPDQLFPQQPYGVPVVVAPPKGLSITGLVLGIASMLGFSYTGLVPIAGIIVSAIAMNKEPAGKPMAIWGLVLSIASIVFAIVGAIMAVTVLAGVVGPLIALIFGVALTGTGGY